jgi:hypothetical protein
MKLIKINVANAGNGSIFINPDLVSSIDVKTLNKNFVVVLTLLSGSRYNLADNTNVSIFETEADANVFLESVVAQLNL